MLSSLVDIFMIDAAGYNGKNGQLWVNVLPLPPPRRAFYKLYLYQRYLFQSHYCVIYTVSNIPLVPANNALL